MPPKSPTLALALMALALSLHAHGHPGQRSTALVLSSSPITSRQIVVQPQQVCRQNRNNRAALKGAAIGAVLGLAVSSNRRHHSATSGALVGAGIGHALSGSAGSTRCQIRYRKHVRTVTDGYRVTYRYRGKIYQTVTRQKPGLRMAIKRRDERRH